MANPNAAHEPSMEEILASIRQIISEDSDAAPARADPRPEARPRPASESAAAPPPPPSAAAARTPERSPGAPLATRGPPRHSEPMSASASDPAHKPAGERVNAGPPPIAAPPQGATPVSQLPAAVTAAAPPHDEQPAADEPKLLSEDSKAAVSGAFGALAHTIFAQNARTLEDIVGDMLRPMLKGWLDDNLPPLVERLVREEIERVSRGRR